MSSVATKHEPSARELQEQLERIQRSSMRLIASYVAIDDADTMRLRFQDLTLALGFSNFEAVLRKMRELGLPISTQAGGNRSENTIGVRGPRLTGPNR